MLLLCLALLPGCRRGREGTTPRPPRWQLSLIERAQADMRCSAVAITSLTMHLVVVTGCGRSHELVGDRRTGLWTAIRSVGSLAVEQMACAPEHLLISSPAPRIRAATGCGRVARYDLICEGLTCAWQMTVHAGGWEGASFETRMAHFGDLLSVPEGPLTTDPTPYAPAAPEAEPDQLEAEPLPPEPNPE